jgi:hypothetical protein
VDTVEKPLLPAQGRSGFEVAGWDGVRWVLEGVFDTSVEAEREAKTVLSRRLGVKLTEEFFNAADGVFKSRVVLTEFRDGAPKPERRPAADGLTTLRDVAAFPRPQPKTAPSVVRVQPEPHRAASADTVLYIAISSLVISIMAMLFAIAR